MQRLFASNPYSTHVGGRCSSSITWIARSYWHLNKQFATCRTEQEFMFWQRLGSARIVSPELSACHSMPLQKPMPCGCWKSTDRFPQSDHDDEWKAALQIARRLDGHCLAVEVVAVFLWQNPDVSYQDYLVRLQEEGVAAVEGAGEDELVQLSRHTEKLVGSLLEPTLGALSPAELSVVESASLLPPDNIPVPWLQEFAAGHIPRCRTRPTARSPKSMATNHSASHWTADTHSHGG